MQHRFGAAPRKPAPARWEQPRRPHGSANMYSQISQYAGGPVAAPFCSCTSKARASPVRACQTSAPPLERSPSGARQISQYAGGPTSGAFQRHSGAERLPSWVPQHIARFAEPLKGSAQAVVLTPKMLSPGWGWLFECSSRARVSASGGAEKNTWLPSCSGVAPKAPNAPKARLRSYANIWIDR